MLRAVVHRMAWVAVAGALWGCPSADLGTACGFDGDRSTACGECIARSCGEPIDGCCADEGCLSRVMPAVDACAAKGDCSRLPTEAPAVGECIRDRCAGPCGLNNVCAIAGKLGPSCTCVSPGARRPTANVVERCSGDSLAKPVVLCCATGDWPAAGSCACVTLDCSTGTCICYDCSPAIVDPLCVAPSHAVDLCK